MHLKVGSESEAINLSKLINDGNWMVLYYAEWCGHCKDMKPEWQKVIENFSNKKTNSNKVNVAEIESEHIKSLLNKPEIKGFPTIKMYNNGKEIGNFEKERVAPEILKFANNNAKIANATNKISELKIENKPNNEIANILSSITSSKMEGIKNNVINTNAKSNKNNFNNLIMKLNSSIKSQAAVENKTSLKKQASIVNKLNNDIACVDIRYAKACKKNPKCMYDGRNLRCKDRPITNIFKKKTQTQIIFKSKKPSVNKTKSTSKPSFKSSSKSSSKSTSKSKASSKPSSNSNTNFKYKSKNTKKNFNLSKTTKSVFNQLIKSFGKIGNEAKKDSKLLKNASNKL